MTLIDVFDTWQKIMSEVNVQQGGQIRPQIDFQNWYNAINLEIFHEKAAKIQLGQQNSDELLLPFLKTVIIPVAIQSGMPWDLVSYPADYEYFSSMRVLRAKDVDTCMNNRDKSPEILLATGKSLRYTDPDYAAMLQKYAGNDMTEGIVYLADNQRWESVLSHVTKGPTYQKPKATQYSGGYKIAPKGIQAVILDYLRTPRSAVFAYTIGDGDIVQYNSGGSTQLEWSNVIQNEFLTRLKKKYGVYVQDGAIYQAGAAEKKELV